MVFICWCCFVCAGGCCAAVVVLPLLVSSPPRRGGDRDPGGAGVVSLVGSWSRQEVCPPGCPGAGIVVAAWPPPEGRRPRAAIAHGDRPRGRCLAAGGRVGSLGPGVHMCAAKAAERESFRRAHVVAGHTTVRSRKPRNGCRLPEAAWAEVPEAVPEARHRFRHRVCRCRREDQRQRQRQRDNPRNCRVARVFRKPSTGGDRGRRPLERKVPCCRWSGGLFGSRRPHVCGPSSGAGELGPCPCGRGAHQGDPTKIPGSRRGTGTGSTSGSRACWGGSGGFRAAVLPDALPSFRRCRRRGRRGEPSGNGNGNVAAEGAG